MILGDVEETVTSVEIDDETYEEIVRVSIFDSFFFQLHVLAAYSGVKLDLQVYTSIYNLSWGNCSIFVRFALKICVEHLTEDFIQDTMIMPLCTNILTHMLLVMQCHQFLLHGA